MFKINVQGQGVKKAEGQFSRSMFKANVQGQGSKAQGSKCWMLRSKFKVKVQGHSSKGWRSRSVFKVKVKKFKVQKAGGQGQCHVMVQDQGSRSSIRMNICSIYIYTCPVNMHCHFNCTDRFRLGHLEIFL